MRVEAAEEVESVIFESHHPLQNTNNILSAFPHHSSRSRAPYVIRNHYSAMTHRYLLEFANCLHVNTTRNAPTQTSVRKSMIVFDFPYFSVMTESAFRVFHVDCTRKTCETTFAYNFRILSFSFYY